ncbi:MAG: hypothetical protein M3Y56_11905, partial [Armatimonadota bacterium]|nr:hypothetical protein [Armatimonadota bacterium]
PGVVKVYAWTPYAAFDHGYEKLLATVTDPAGPARDHRVRVTLLKPHTRYSFQVFSTVGSGSEAIELESERETFTTRSVH